MKNFVRFARRVLRNLDASGIDGRWMRNGLNPSRPLCDDAALVIRHLKFMLKKERNRKKP